jgi:hypothetical protein
VLCWDPLLFASANWCKKWQVNAASNNLFAGGHISSNCTDSSTAAPKTQSVPCKESDGKEAVVWLMGDQMLQDCAGQQATGCSEIVLLDSSLLLPAHVLAATSLKSSPNTNRVANLTQTSRTTRTLLACCPRASSKRCQPVGLQAEGQEQTPQERQSRAAKASSSQKG